jgi:hypothetical protein
MELHEEVGSKWKRLGLPSHPGFQADSGYYHDRRANYCLPVQDVKCDIKVINMDWPCHYNRSIQADQN